jgi:hypothetical protein
MTSLGFEASLNPYKITPAELACYLTGSDKPLITEKNMFSRYITNIKSGTVIGYKYFDFGEDFSSKTMEFHAEVLGTGCKSKITIMLDDPVSGLNIGSLEIGMDSGNYSAPMQNVTGRHAVYFVVEDCFGGWFKEMFNGRNLFEFISFVFIK